MNAPGLPVTIMAVAALVALLVSIYAYKVRAAPGGRFFRWLMVAIVIYSVTTAGELAAPGIPAKLVWSKLTYLGIVSVAPLWLLFSVDFCQWPPWLTPLRQRLVWVVPVVTLALAVTNDLHGLVWRQVTPVPFGTGWRLVYSYGPAVWFHAVYAYLLFLAGLLLLIQACRSSTPLFRRQATALIVAGLIPWVANLLYVFKFNPWPGLDLTPLAFLATGLVTAWSFYRFRMLDLVPVAHHVLFNSLSEGVLVLDNRNRIIDLNQAAQRWIGAGPEVTGKEVTQVIRWRPIYNPFLDASAARSELEIPTAQGRLLFDLLISPLKDKYGRQQGRVVLLRDISRERAVLTAEQRRARHMELLSTITNDTLATHDLQQMLQVLSDRLGELFQADGVYLTLWDKDRELTIPRAAYGQMRIDYPTIKTEPGEFTLTASVLRAGRPLAIEDAFNTPYLSPRIAAKFPTRSMLALPLIAAGDKLGAAIISFHQPHRFSPEEIALGEQVGAQISLAVSKVILYETEKRRSAQLAALQSVSQAVVSSLDLEQIFTTVVRVMQDTFGYHYVSIYLLEGEMARLGAQTGYPPEKIHSEIPIHSGIIGRTIRTRRPQFVPDVSADPEFLDVAGDIGSEICLPLLKDQSVLGVLNVEGPRDRPLTRDDLNLLTTFSTPVTLAIDKALLYAEVQRLAIVDDLTGLYNRRGLFEFGCREFERARRFSRPLGVLFLDIDYFKCFNDTYSYAVGDQVLRQIAACLKANLREVDLIGRYGGEEFVALLPETDLPVAAQVAERVRRAVEEMRLEVDGGAVSITVSIGASQSEPNTSNLDAFIEQAGQALHTAKSAGRNQVALL